MRSSFADAARINTSINLIKHAAANAKTAAGKDIVLVIGPAGGGKSTLINCLLHKKLVAVETESGDYEFTKKDSKDDIKGPAIGPERYTGYTEVFSAKNGLAFYDIADFSNMVGAGKTYSDHASYYALHVVTRVAKSVKAILFVCDINEMKTLRGKFFADAVELLTTMLHTNKEYGRSVFFLITKAHNYTHSQVMNLIRKQRDILEVDGKESAVELLRLLEAKPNSVIKVSPEDLIEEAGLDFASRMHKRLIRGVEIEQKHFSVGGGETGKEKYLQAYQHIMNQAFNQIQALTWKMEDLAAAENDIKTIEQNILSHRTHMVTTEIKLEAAGIDLMNKNREHQRKWKALYDQLSTIPDEAPQLKKKLEKELEKELENIDEEEMLRHIGFLGEIKRQDETNLKIAELGVEENIKNREDQITDLEEKINQARAKMEAKKNSLDTLKEEKYRLIARNERATQALDEELHRSQIEADQLVISLQDGVSYKNFTIFREIKLEIDRHRDLVTRLDHEIEALESERQKHQIRISELKNDNSDYLIHTSSEWDEHAVYAVVPVEKPSRRFSYYYRGSCDIKRDDYSAVTAVGEGTHGLIIDRFLRERECGGTYLLLSHAYGRFKHYVYISQKNSPENIGQAARLQILCDALATRQLEKKIRHDLFQQEIKRLEIELRDRLNDEEQRIREQARSRRLEVENRREEKRQLFGAALQELNCRIRELQLEIFGLEMDIRNGEFNIAVNRAAIIEFKQNGHMNVRRMVEEGKMKISMEREKTYNVIAQRQEVIRDQRELKVKEKIDAKQTIRNQIENTRRIQDIEKKLVDNLVTELARKKQAILTYDTHLRQTKEHHVRVLKDLGEVYYEFIGWKPAYDAVIELFTLLKLENNYIEFIGNYLGFLNTLFIKVHGLMNPTSPSLSNADLEQKRAVNAKPSSQEAPSAARSPHAMFASLPAESDAAPLVPFLSLAAPPRPSRP